MKILQRPERLRQPRTSSSAIDASHAPQWHYIQAYLKASNAQEGLQSDIDAAMAVLPETMVLRHYIDLIRTTFKMKIAPALSQVVPSAQTFVGVAHNLNDGLSRYESCFRRLHVKSGDITGPFQALVRCHIAPDAWAPAVRLWISGTMDRGAESELANVHRIAHGIGLGELFEKSFKEILGTRMAYDLQTKHAREWDVSNLFTLLGETIETPRRLLRLLDINFDDGQLQVLLQEGLATLRISELFDIVVDFPSSAPAVEDLKSCLRSTSTRAELVKQFREQCQNRLLHPGANTPDIITVYISTIKVFLVLDPPGVLLDKVARPIRKYLRERTDTIRCIITSLLGEVDSDLAHELSNQEMPTEVDDEDDPMWLPDPIDAAPDYAKNRASDIIGSLISIYENKDVFARELQALLADRLLAITDYNIDQELRNLEMLKVRFGDGMLSVCDVMLKDMNDSRRIDVATHEREARSGEDQTIDNVVHTTIVSRLYWPTMKSSTFASALSDEDDQIEQEGLKLPAPIVAMLNNYSARFSQLKAQRTLVFHKELGHVRVKLDLEDREFDMMVTPSHATSISLFNDRSTMSIAEISQALNISEQETRRNLAFWVKQGILDLQEDQYTVLETIDHSAPVHPSMMEEVVLDIVEEVDEMSTYWNFIVGMLTNVGALEPDRIHSMLGMFAPSYDRSLDQLKTYLQKRTRDGEVEVKGGSYRLPATT